MSGYELALEDIALRRMPCHTCGKVHVPIEQVFMAPQWSDPDDGHPFRQMSAEDYAKKVLREAAAAAGSLLPAVTEGRGDEP